MRANHYHLIGCLSASLLSANGQGLLINASALGAMEHNFAPGFLISEKQAFSAPTPAVSLRDYNAITMVFSAPAGYAWRTRTDYPGTYNSLACVFAYGSKPADASARRVDYHFDFVTGMEGAVSYNGDGWGTGWVSERGFGLDGLFEFGGDVAFTTLTITTYAAPGSQPVPLDNFTEAVLRFQMTGNVPPSDPGAHAFLLAVPEPAVSSLLALGASLLFIRGCLRPPQPARAPCAHLTDRKMASESSAGQ
jgi:hypothetical protein